MPFRAAAFFRLYYRSVCSGGVGLFQVGEDLHVEPLTGSDACVRHASCRARAAPSLARIIATLGMKPRWYFILMGMAAYLGLASNELTRLIPPFFPIIFFLPANVARDVLAANPERTRFHFSLLSGMGLVMFGMAIYLFLRGCVRIAQIAQDKTLPNHSPDPTPAPGMPPAGQESRHS